MLDQSKFQWVSDGSAVDNSDHSLHHLRYFAPVGDSLSYVSGFAELDAALRSCDFSMAAETRSTVHFTRYQRVRNQKGRPEILSTSYGLKGSIWYRRKNPLDCLFHAWAEALEANTIEEVAKSTRIPARPCFVRIYSDLIGSGARAKSRLLAIHALGLTNRISHLYDTIMVNYKTAGGKACPEGRHIEISFAKADLEAAVMQCSQR